MLSRTTSTRLGWATFLCVLAACGGSSSNTAPADGGGGGGGDEGGALDGSWSGGGEGGGGADSGKPPLTGPLVHLRVMAANITSGTQQSYEAAGIRIFQGLAPDVVLIQEFRYATGTLRSLVDTAFGAGFGYYVEPRTTGIPNGIVSRYPILDSGTWVDSNVSDRAYAWARIDVPGPTDLWAVSLHLLTTGASQRDAEAQELVKDIQGKIPAGDYLVVGGDLNTDATNEPALLDLASVVTLAAPFPADQLGNNNSSTNRNRPHDWVLASPGLHAREVPVVLGSSTYPSGLVFDTRVYTPLTDVMPILAGDSAVSGMQHMPVVREFTVESPAEAGTGTDAGPSDAGLDAADTGSE